MVFKIETTKRKKIIIATPEKIKQINPQNLELWKKYLNGKNMKLSDSTKYNYESDMNQFFIYILNNYDNKFIFDIDSEDMSEILEDYISFCANFLNNKVKRIARRLSSISSLYLYYKKKRKVKENPLDLIERPIVDNKKFEVKQTYLTKDQVDLIRVELEKQDNLQLQLFFDLGLSTLARVNALSNIPIDNIILEDRVIERIIEKEGYEVTLIFSDRCKELIQKWLDYRKENNIDCKFLFITKYKGVWDRTDKSVMQNGWIKKIGKIINEPSLHCHDLRHSGSNLLFQAGLPIEEVSALLNHKGLDVTKQHYISMDMEKIKTEKDKYEI